MTPLKWARNLTKWFWLGNATDPGHNGARMAEDGSGDTLHIPSLDLCLQWQELRCLHLIS